MTPKQRSTRIAEIKSWLATQGYTEDKYGNFKSADVRYKFTATGLRKERNIGSRWVRMRSGYIKDVTVVEGKLEGLTV